MVTDAVPGVDLERLDPWLAAHVEPHPEGELSARLLAGGRSNISCAVSDSVGRTWVVRRPPLGHVMPSAHDMGREFRVLSGLNRVGVPAPRALAYCEDTSVIGAPFLLMDFVDGRVIDSTGAALALGEVQATAVAESLVDTLARIHCADVDAAGLGQLGRPEGFLARQVTRWQQQWQLSRTRPLDAVDELATRLEPLVAAVPNGLPWSLVHGDYRLDNTILDPAAPQVIAVVDWEMATLGDPVGDLAIALVYWTQQGDVLRNEVPVAPHITDQPGFISRQQIIDRYASATGFDLGHLDVCAALACFKLAVIMESIRFRALEGLQVGDGADVAESMGEATIALAELGHRVLEQGTVAGLAS